MKTHLIRAAIFCFVVAFLTGCATVPETGRSQLRLVSPQQEMQLGLSSFEKMKQETPISKDPAANALVQKVGQRIAAVANLPGAQWEFVVFDSKEANAFALPGGKVGIYTGILPITKDEAGLATVIGHEVAHAALHHGAERMSEAMAMQLGGQLLGTTVSAYNPQWEQVATTLYGLGSTLGRSLPHSRFQESEADRIGLRYMARAGYNPESAIGFWERFSAHSAKGGSAPWFLRTHPVDSTRIEQIRQWIPEAMQEYRAQGGQVISDPSGARGSDIISRPE